MKGEGEQVHIRKEKYRGVGEKKNWGERKVRLVEGYEKIDNGRDYELVSSETSSS